MKDGFENIEEVLKQAFDSYEAHVDPSVWSNVKNSIGNNTIPNNVSPKTNPSLTSSLTKSILLKMVAGIVALSSIGVAVFVATTDDVTEKNIVQQVEAVEVLNNEEKLPSLIDEKQPSPVNEQFLINDEVTIIEVDEDEVEKEERVIIEEEVKLVEIEENIEQEDVAPSEVDVKKATVNPQKADVESSEGISEVKANIVSSTLLGKAPLEIQFDAEGNGVQYFWDFNDGSELSNEKSPIHVFSEPGIYKVALTVLDEKANTKTVVNFIQVEKNVTSTLNEGGIPNAISPNGDGSNDELRVTGENIKVFNARVMNASGKVVYEWNNIEGKWDGRDMSENLLMPGVYYLAVIAIGEDGERHIKNQTVNLYR